MSARPGITCAGSIVADASKVIYRYPALDHLAVIEDISLSTGGPAVNMAVDLRQLGATFPVGLVGAVGEDAHAAFLLAECARLGIDAAGVRELPGAATSFNDIMVERDGGRRTMFLHNGTNGLGDGADIDLSAAAAR